MKNTPLQNQPTADEAREWYARTFAEAAETDSLPLPQSDLSSQTSEVRTQLFPLAVTKADIKAIGDRLKANESVVLQAAWAQLLATYGAEEKASFCIVDANQKPLPVFVQTNGDTTIGDLLAAIDEQRQQLASYSNYSYEDAVRDLGLNNQVLFACGDAVDDNIAADWKLIAGVDEHDGQYAIRLHYSADNYSEAFMAELAKCFSAILQSMATAQTVRELRYTMPEQTEWLNKLNPEFKEVPLPTLIERFKQHVAERPNDIFCVAGNTRLTFAEADRLSDEIDPSYTVRCGKQVVGFSVPRDERMALAPLAIVKAGLTQLPLDSSYPEERLAFMREDASKYEGKDALVLLYTSGTTGLPKGVMLSEKSFCSFENFNTKNIGLKPGSRYATYAGYGFDAFQCDFWACVWAGATLHIIQDDIRFDLEALYQYLIKEKITHLFMTTQMATQMVLNYPDVPSLEWLGTGGEKLMSLNPPKYRLMNGYGPTETTVYVCSHYVDKNEPNIPIGKPNDDVELFIVNKYGKQVPWGASGELIVAGPQVGLGYLNQPEKTAAVYVDWNGKRVYRTGDIVRYRENGDIEFVGRKDGQVKIRGFRIELKEVEGVIRAFDGIKDATVQAFDYPDGGKYIAAYVVSDQPVDIDALNNFILDQKPPYMVPAVTMQIDAIPLTQNQKVNKRALPDPSAASQPKQEAVAAPLNVLEEQLHALVADIVKINNFDITTDLRYVGLSSISAVKLATKVYKRYGVQLDAKKFIKGGSVQTIENAILESLLNQSDSPKDGLSAERSVSDSGPLSYAQLGVYFECMKNPTSTLYNVPTCIQFPLEVSTDDLKQAIRTAVMNHPELFAHFRTIESEARQTVQVVDNWDIDVLEMTEAELEQYKHEFVRPFNLQKDLLFRFAIVRTEKVLYVLNDIHHLVCDGASVDLFIHELCNLLEDKPIEPELCSYIQFAADQKAAESSEAFQQDQAFFAERLGDIEGITEIPSDLSNPLQQGENGRVCVPIDITTAEQIAGQLGVTPAAVVLAATYYTLARFANSDDVCITTISNGRSNLQISNTCGMFVNTLALTAKIGEQSVEQFIHETAETFEATLEHENYPFARIANDYNLQAEIMFAYQIGVLSDYSVFGKPVYADETMEQKVPKFKIAIYIMPIDGVPSVALEYDDGRYSEAMMRSMAQSISNAVQAFAQSTAVALRSVSLINAQQTALLDSFNNTQVDYDKSQTVLSLFCRQAAQTPDNIAVIYRDLRLTYREVDERTNAIAAEIINQKSKIKNLKSKPVVSILINRSEWMVLASLGALKAGCAYQPLDPSYPAERLNFMMQDANAALLIADEDLRDKVEYTGPVLLTKELSDVSNNRASKGLRSQKSELSCELNPEDLFILLYTSGSTGVPKGCQLTHANLVAFCHWYQRYYNLQPSDKVAAYASYGFDACMMDMYPALTHGAAVCIIPEDLRLNLPDLNNYFNKEGVTLSFMTTQVGCQFAMNCDNHSLRHLSVGGEKILPLTPPTNYQMHNGYGPTECTIFTTTYPLHEYEQNAPIGKPLDNLQLFVVDKDLNRLPVGASGELLVSGPQVSKGYLNQPEKTAQTYINWNGLRCYRTGDVTRLLADGNVQFVGRRDGQVKIRGFRIELKEVEAVIREFPDIKDATVQAFDYPNGGKFIAAYVVSDKKIDVAALNSFIRERKPPYMVPAATMQIDVIPLNQNQKVNRKALPAPQLQADNRDYVAPANNLEKLFCDIFASILSMDQIGATDNFFELGGTSLMVTRVVIEADKAGHHVAYGDIFTHATPRLLAQFLGSGTEETEDTEVEGFDYKGIDAILQHNNLNMFLKGERQTLGNVLLTGATGYLGIHVLRELIDSDAKSITCLVRGKTQEEAEQRLKKMLFYYFESSFKDLFGSRLHVVIGDVTSDMTQAVSNHIDTVFNCAANVKHFSKTDDIEQVNYGGAQQCVQFCLKTGARLIHISTTSVGEIYLVRDDGQPVPMLDERKLWFGQYLDNRYVHSKFLAERIILDAVAHHGLNAKVMRVGNLAARSYDGEFQANFRTNSYMGKLKVYSLLGCCPVDEYDDLTEFSPIDQTAKAVVLLASTPKECNLFQPFNNHTELLGDVLQIFENIGRPIRFVEEQAFNDAVQRASQDPEKTDAMSALLAYQDLTHGQKAVVIERDNRYTCNVLHRLGFHWQDTSHDYIERMLTAIDGLGFFD